MSKSVGRTAKVHSRWDRFTQNFKKILKNNDGYAIYGGHTVPRIIICRSAIKSYLIVYNNIFYALNTSPDLLRPVAICYFVVGSVVGRIDHHGFSEISTKCRDGD